MRTFTEHAGALNLTVEAFGRPVLRCTKAFTNHFREICVTLASVRPRAPRRRTPDDRARQPYGAAASPCRRTARDQGEQGQERGCGGRGAEVVALQDQQV